MPADRAVRQECVVSAVHGRRRYSADKRAVGRSSRRQILSLVRLDTLARQSRFDDVFIHLSAPVVRQRPPHGAAVRDRFARSAPHAIAWTVRRPVFGAICGSIAVVSVRECAFVYAVRHHSQLTASPDCTGRAVTYTDAATRTARTATQKAGSILPPASNLVKLIALSLNVLGRLA